MCEKLQGFLDGGSLSREHIFYKLIKNTLDFVTASRANYVGFQWDSEILEFLDTIEYYGHEATVHLLRGPGYYKPSGNKAPTDRSKFDWSTWNWPLPGRTTRQKQNKGRYSTDDGVYWPLVQNFLSIISDEDSGIAPILIDAETKLKLFAVASQEDGVALKPGFRIDTHQGKIIGATFPIDLMYTRNNPSPKGEELKDILVKEAHCICVETLDGNFALPVGVHYLPNKVSGEQQLEQSMTSISCMQTCLGCLKDRKMAFKGAVLKGKGHCKSACETCIANQMICAQCSQASHKFLDPALRACNECLEKNIECVKMVCLGWSMDSESKNKKSQTALSETEQDKQTETTIVTPFPDPVHTAKNDRGSFANWYRLIDGYRINLVMLRTARMDSALKQSLLPHLSLAACRNRDRMDVDTVIEICSPEVRQGLQKVQWLVQSLVPEPFRLYDGNKQGVLETPVCVCPASWGTLLVADKERGKIFSARLHYPVDVVEVASGLKCPLAMTHRDGLLVISELGKEQLLCYDLNGDYFLNPDKMTVKQLQKALKDRNITRQGDKTKKDLQATLKSWMSKKCPNAEVSKLQKISIANMPTVQASAISFAGQGTECVFVADMSGNVYELSLIVDGIKATSQVVKSFSIGVGDLFGIAYKSPVDKKLFVTSSADNGGLYVVDLETGASQCLLANGTGELKRAHGICTRKDGTLVIADREDKKIKIYDLEVQKVEVLVGSGEKGVKDGSEGTVCFSQPTSVCREEGADTIYVVDSGAGKLLMVSRVAALIKFLENLWKFLTGFHLTCEEPGNINDTITRTQEYYSFLEEATLRVQQIKGTAAQTQGPDGTLSSTTLDSVRMILDGLNRLKENVESINPDYIDTINVRSILTLFVENLFSTMRAGNTATPTKFEFCLRFPRCVKELLKRVTKTSFNYFTNPKASYYLKPKIEAVTVPFTDLAMFPKPSKGTIAQKHAGELAQWVSLNGKSVRQNTTRNFSTKDKPGTLPLNVYEAAAPKEKAVDFAALVREQGQVSRDGDGRTERRISHGKGTYVVYPLSCRPASTERSTFYVVKLTEDLLEDDHVTDVRTQFYSQDIIDPLLFVTTGEEHVVSKQGIMGLVTNIKEISEDTIEIAEDDYYVILATLHASKDHTLSNEADEEGTAPLLEEDDEREGENESDERPSSRPKRRRNQRQAGNNDYLFY